MRGKMTRMVGSLQPMAKEQEASGLTLAGVGAAAGVGSTWERAGGGSWVGVGGKALRKAQRICVGSQVERKGSGSRVIRVTWVGSCLALYIQSK